MKSLILKKLTKEENLDDIKVWQNKNFDNASQYKKSQAKNNSNDNSLNKSHNEEDLKLIKKKIFIQKNKYK